MSFKYICERLRKMREYLFEDHEFMSGFSGHLDYERYWERRTGGQSSLTGIAQTSGNQLAYYRLDLISRILEPGSKVLELGCGDGSLLAHLKATKQVEALGIDVSHHACELAEAKGIKTQCLDISREVLIPEDMDYIIMVDVLEHLSNPIDVLMHLKGKYRKALLVSIPNTGVISDRLRLLVGRFPRQWILHPSEHLHFWTVTDFLFLCQQLGFGVERYYGLRDVYFDVGPLKLWKHYPRLFSRYILYQIK